ncbi:MAG TPA: InlB B-repeat-containing protein, partial [Methanocorpusculum sp.]|nr:InlB B-repeat-containing protein [Methanocorpusculum sp.]
RHLSGRKKKQVLKNMTKESNTKQKRIFRGAVLAAAVLMLAAVLCVGAASADGGTPKQLTDAELTGYNVLVVNDETGAVETKTADNLGSNPNVYLLEDAADWNAVAIDEEKYNGTVLILDANLDFSTTAEDYMMTYPFTGKIYGNGKIIKDFENATVNEHTLGLIREAGGNLDLNYVQMVHCSIISTKNYAGSLVGLINATTGNKTVNIIGCSVSDGYMNVGSVGGGLVGYIGRDKGADPNTANLTVNHSTVIGWRIDTVGGNSGGIVGFTNAPCVFSAYNCSVLDCLINATGSANGGFSGGLCRNSEAVDCKAINCTVYGKNQVGGFLGSLSYATIINCIAQDCRIIATSYTAGGLTGTSLGSSRIESCAAMNCTVTSTQYWVGGLSGSVSGTSIINNSMASGNITGKTKVGGLVGVLESGTQLNNCIALNEIVSSTTAPPNGRVVGDFVGGTISNCYAWDGMLVNGNLVSTDVGPSLKNGTNASSGIFWNNQSFFQNTLGWNFDNVWKMNDGNENYKLPVLKWQTTPVLADASYLIPVTVSFNSQGGSAVANQKITKGFNATRPADPTKTGYTFENWYNESACAGVFNFESMLTADTTAYANWTVYSTTNSSLESTGSAKVATFNDDGNAVKSVAIQNASTAVTAVAVAYEPNTAGPSSDGSYTRTALTPVFNITLTGDLGSDNATVVFNLTTAELNGASPSNIYLAHKKNGVWEYLKPSYTQTGDVYTFTVTGVDSFSPFVPISMTAIPSPTPQPQSSSSHSSSRNDGASVWLTATPTPVPTNAVPTAEPTQAVPVASPVKPQPTQTSASPVPFIGILAGLGAAAVFFGLRRR